MNRDVWQTVSAIIFLTAKRWGARDQTVLFRLHLAVYLWANHRICVTWEVRDKNCVLTTRHVLPEYVQQPCGAGIIIIIIIIITAIFADKKTKPGAQ